MTMPGRSFSAASQYRYGFNGKENDNEVKGQGNQLDFGARIYDPRLGRFQSSDFFAALKPGICGYNFASDNPICRIDPDGNFDVDPKASKREKKALNSIGNEYSKYLNGLEVGSQELNALLKRSGYKSKETLIAAWDRKGAGSIVLRFSVHNESDAVPDHGHERTGAPGQDSYYLHPDGNNSIDGAFATGGGVRNGGGTITFAKTLLNFQESLNSKKWVSPADPESSGDNTAFNYEVMQAGGYKFLNRIIGHEMTHVGAAINGLPVSVAGYNFAPSWIKRDAVFGSSLFALYHRGDVFESEAYLKPVTHTDAEYGFAVNVYFRALGRMDCSVRKNPILPVSISDAATNQAIWNYIMGDSDLRRVFKPGNKHNRGYWNIPVEIDH